MGSGDYDKRFRDGFYVCPGKFMIKEKRPAPKRGWPLFFKYLIHETVGIDTHGFFFFDENVEQMD